MLAATDGSLPSVEQPGKRRLFRGALASAAAALGLPLVGSTGASAADEPGEIIETYSRPEAVENLVAQNEGLFAGLDDLQLLEGATGAGLQVSAVPVDGEHVPQVVLYLDADAGMLSLVLSPTESPLGSHVHVVTTEETMGEVPVEWPDERRTEFPDFGILFGVDRDGWTDPGFVETEPLDDGAVVNEICKDPIETLCGPVSDGNCWYRGCCGKIQRKPCQDSGGGSGGLDFDSFPSCEDSEEGKTCWWVSFRDNCECPDLTLPP